MSESLPHAQPSSPQNASLLWTFFHSHKVGLLTLLILLYGLLYLFAWRDMRFFLVPSSSMEPALLRGDYILTLNHSPYQRGDIVVIIDAQSGEYLVKRIAGLPGDRVTVQGGALFLNGKYVSEPYIAEPMKYEITDPVTVPANQVFLLGDNRNNSDDSHVNRQCDPISKIVGKVQFIYYPYTRFGFVYSYPLSGAQ
ncbi:MAG TPA: signal peptidase I [Candidatus Hydrogenedentes bacterium]|mgnify:CR=1 FL=1|nr:signal peptidase I [Candidatus Hydrogenedentota bacterium]